MSICYMDINKIPYMKCRNWFPFLPLDGGTYCTQCKPKTFTFHITCMVKGNSYQFITAIIMVKYYQLIQTSLKFAFHRFTKIFNNDFFKVKNL